MNWDELLTTTPKVSCCSYPPSGWRVHDLGWAIDKDGWITFVKDSNPEWVAEQRAHFNNPEWTPVPGLASERFCLLNFTLTVNELYVAYDQPAVKSRAYVHITEDARLIGTVVNGMTYGGPDDDGSPCYRQPREKALLFDWPLASITDIGYLHARRLMKWWDGEFECSYRTPNASARLTAGVITDYKHTLPKGVTTIRGFAEFLADAVGAARGTRPTWTNDNAARDQSISASFDG